MRIVRCLNKFVLASAFVLMLAGASTVGAQSKDESLEKVLRKLDVAATSFHTTSADFEFDTIQTDPLPDKDIQKGTVYYERKGKNFQMAAHIQEVNGKSSPRIYSYSGGVVKLYEVQINQVTTLNKASQFESYLMLGFGASGKDLEDKFDIKYLGSETLEGIKTEKLEMVAKDPAVKKNIPKVTIWVDPDRGVSLKQVFDQGSSGYRVNVYFNLKVNQSLPADAFTFKTDKQTQFINR